MTLDQCVFGFVPFLNRSAIDKQALKVEEVSTVKVQASETSMQVFLKSMVAGEAGEPSIESSGILIKYLRHTGLH